MGRGRWLSRGEGAWFPFGIARGGWGGEDGDLGGKGAWCLGGRGWAPWGRRATRLGGGELGVLGDEGEDAPEGV